MELRSLATRKNLRLDARFYVSILVLILFVSFSFSPAAFADTVDDPGIDQGEYPWAGSNGSELAEELLSLLDASRSQVEAILEQLALDGAVIPDAVYETISLAEEAAAEALLLMESGMYPEVSEKATEALQLYGEALQMALDSHYGVLENILEENFSVSQEFWDSLNRGYAYLNDVNDTARDLAEAGVDVSQVDGLLDMAEVLLVQAEELLARGDAEGAEEELESAFTVLDGAMTLMQTLNEDLTSEKTAGFLANSEWRLERLEEEILFLIDPLSFEPEDFDALLKALEEAHLKNRELKDLLEGGDLSAVLSGFEGLQECSDDIFEIMGEGDTDTAKYLKKTYKVWARNSHHEEKGSTEAVDPTPSDPEPETGEDSKGRGSNAKPDKGNNGKKSPGLAGSSQGGDSPPSNGSGDKGKDNGKSKGGLKIGHSLKTRETE